MLQNIIKLQKKIIPELVELLEKRYLILRTISYNQPVGRRVLANKVDLGERIVRNEINFLKNQGLIEINTPGMTVTEEGIKILDSLKDFIHEVKGLSKVETEIKNLLNIKNVIVIPGSVEEDKNILHELGKATSQYAKKIIRDGDIVAITGGSTVKEVVDSFPRLHNLHDVLIVPARGGMGKKVETQANTLCATLAQKLNGSYKMLHIPENISSDVMKSLFSQKDIKEVFDLIRSSNLLIYGIGRADKMVQKRGISEERQNELIKLGAVGEAVGCYFDKDSNVVSISSAPGISIKELSEAREHIAVAGGKGKVEAIISALCNNAKAVLVTDEAAAEEIVKALKG